jgi:hypothetical protein
MPLYSTFTWRAKSVLLRDRGYHKIVWHAECPGPIGLTEYDIDTHAHIYEGAATTPVGVSIDQHLGAVQYHVIGQCGYRYWQTRSYRQCP